MARPSANTARLKPISKSDGKRFLARIREAGTSRWSKAVYVGRREIGTLATLLLFAALALTFGIVANEMSTGNTRAFDNAVVMALRSDANPSDPLGPMWFEGAVRDITSLGSNAVLIILTLGTVGFLALSGARGAALHVLVSVGSGAILIQVLKELFGRVRPDVVPQAVSEMTRSFPSGHATLAAVTYLTLGALVARVQPKPARKMYVLFVAILLTLLVGVSRVYLGRSLADRRPGRMVPWLGMGNCMLARRGPTATYGSDGETHRHLKLVAGGLPRSLCSASRLRRCTPEISLRSRPADRRSNPPRHAVLIDDSGIAVSVRFVLGFAFGRCSLVKRSCICRVDVIDPQV